MDLSNLKNMSSLLNASNQSVNVVEVELDKIISKPQVRAEQNFGFENQSLSQLAESIKSIGVQQPIILRKDPDANDRYIIVCGERRYRASKLAEKTTIPAIIRDDLLDDKDIMVVQITENIQREDISSIEIAAAAKQLVDLGMKVKDIAEKLGKTNSAISEYLKMLEMPPFLMNLLADGILSSSPRTCADYARLYEENPILVERYINEYIEQERQENNERERAILDRSLIKQFRAYITSETTKKNEEEPEKFEINLNSNSDPEVEQSNESEEAESDDYPDHEEREHSEAPKMAPAHQENTEHTAGIGKPSYTDQDTRTEHDLSDGLERKEAAADYADSVEADSSENGEDLPEIISSFLVEYEGRQCRFNLEKGHDNDHVMIEEENFAREVKLSELKIIKILK